MKIISTAKVSIVALALVGGLGLSAVSVLAAQPSKMPDPMQIARGAQEWRDNCGRCHNLRDPKEFTDSKWEVIVSQMRVRGNLPGKVERDITTFLKASN